MGVIMVGVQQAITRSNLMEVLFGKRYVFYSDTVLCEF